MRQRTRDLRESATGDPDARGGFNPGAVRQYRDEARQRLADARELRDRLADLDIDPDDIDQILRGLTDLADRRTYDDPVELERLQAAMADQAKRLELMLRVQLTGEERARLFLSGADAVSAEYRALVEEYFRALSREGGGR